MDEIELIKGDKRSITGMQSWTPPAEVLDNLIRNMAKQEI